MLSTEYKPSEPFAASLSQVAALANEFSISDHPDQRNLGEALYAIAALGNSGYLAECTEFALKIVEVIQKNQTGQASIKIS
jgi:hypothetical protein